MRSSHGCTVSRAPLMTQKQMLTKSENQQPDETKTTNWIHPNGGDLAAGTARHGAWRAAGPHPGRPTGQ